MRAKSSVSTVLKSSWGEALFLAPIAPNRTVLGIKPTPTHPLSCPLPEKPPGLLICMWHMHKHRAFGRKAQCWQWCRTCPFGVDGYFEYLHALRDLSCPSSVLSDGTKPQPLEMPGSGCKLHLKWAEHQKWRQPYTVRTV